MKAMVFRSADDPSLILEVSKPDGYVHIFRINEGGHKVMLAYFKLSESHATDLANFILGVGE